MPVCLFHMQVFRYIGVWYFNIIYLAKTLTFNIRIRVFTFDPNTLMFCLSSRWFRLIFLGLTIVGYLTGCIERMDSLHHWRKITNLMLKIGIQAMVLLSQNLR